MGTRTYYRDSHGRFHGSAGAAGSSVGRAGGFAVTGRPASAATRPSKPTGSRTTRTIARIGAAQRSQFRAIGRGASAVAHNPAAQRIIVRSAIVGGIGLASSAAGKRMRARQTKYAPAVRAIGMGVKAVRVLDHTEAPVRVFVMSQPKALGMGPKGRAAVRARKRRGSTLYWG